MINWIYLILISTVIPYLAGEGLFQSDPKAKEVLSRTSTTFNGLESLKASMNIEIIFPEQEPYIQEAVAYIKSDNFRLEMADENLICDGKSLWRYLKEMNEVQISDYEPAEDEITPTNIFNIYENDFYFLYVSGNSEMGEGYDVVDLSPMNKDKSYFKVRVWVSQQDDLIHRMKVFDKNGSRYIYTIDSLEKNPTLRDGLFQFDPDDYPADLHIEELRF